MDLELHDRTVLVTGGSGDIGRAIAAVFAAEGARVAVAWHRNEPATGTRVQLDQQDEASIADAVNEVGPVDVFIANAVAWPTGPETWDTLGRDLLSNVRGTMTVAEAVLPAMREQGWGRIVFISSDVVDQPIPAGVGYPAAKGALEAAARVLAVREAPCGVLTNVVRPGFTLTDRALGTPGFGQEVVDSEAAKTPTGRICTPHDVARTVVYLASGANGHVNGEVVSVSGGRELTR